LLLLVVPPFSSLRYTHFASIFTSAQPKDQVSYSPFYNKAKLQNNLFTPRVFNINGPNTKILATDQSLRRSLPNLPQQSHLNLASSRNVLQENENFWFAANQLFNPFISSLLNKSQYGDYRLFNHLTSAQSFNFLPQPATHSLNLVTSNSLEYDKTTLQFTTFR
jgi:hypothetical protein